MSARQTTLLTAIAVVIVLVGADFAIRTAIRSKTMVFLQAPACAQISP